MDSSIGRTGTDASLFRIRACCRTSLRRARLVNVTLSIWMPAPIPRAVQRRCLNTVMDVRAINTSGSSNKPYIQLGDAPNWIVEKSNASVATRQFVVFFGQCTQSSVSSGPTADTVNVISTASIGQS